VINLEQTAATEGRLLESGCREAQEGAMSKADQFWQYVEEAMLSASRAKTDKDKQAMLKLAHTWAQAALQSESNAAACVSRPEAMVV
jgi:hypothetical protein